MSNTSKEINAIPVNTVIRDIDGAIEALKGINLSNADIEIQSKAIELEGWLKLADEARQKARHHGVSMKDLVERFLATYESTHTESIPAGIQWQVQCARYTARIRNQSVSKEWTR